MRHKIQEGAGMAKGQKKSNREAKKPKKSAAEKSSAGGKTNSLGIVSASSQSTGSSYKARFNKGNNG